MVIGRNKSTFSQNFVNNSQIVRQLIARSNLKSTDTVLEIGPGKGIITKELAKHCANVIAVEKDRTLAPIIDQISSDFPNIKYHIADFLDWRLPTTPYKIFANIPFSITAEIIEKILKAAVFPDAIFLFMQREAALKFVGAPYSPETQSSVIVKAFYDVQIIYDIDRINFTPKPQIDIVLIGFYKKTIPLVNRHVYSEYKRFVKYTFSQWKGTVYESLKKVFTRNQLTKLDKAMGISSKKPSELAFSDWLDLFQAYLTFASDSKTIFRS